MIEDHNKHNIDTGLLLERLWLSIFNYQKNNKYYLKLSSKDYKINYNILNIANNIVNLNIKTFLPLYMVLYIDDEEYFLTIGFYGIFLRRNKSSYRKHLPDVKILKESGFNNVKIILKQKLQIIVNNKLYINEFIKGNNIKSIKIDPSYAELKVIL